MQVGIKKKQYLTLLEKKRVRRSCFQLHIENRIIMHLPVRLYYQAKNEYPTLNVTQLSLSGKFKDKKKTKTKTKQRNKY